MSKKTSHPDLPWIVAAKKRGASKKRSLIASKPILTRLGNRFALRVGMSVFGIPTYFDIDSAIFEFKNFVETNSKLDLDIVVHKYKPLALNEYHIFPGRGACCFVDPKYLSKQTLDKLPKGCSSTDYAL